MTAYTAIGRITYNVVTVYRCGVDCKAYGVRILVTLKLLRTVPHTMQCVWGRVPAFSFVFAVSHSGTGPGMSMGILVVLPNVSGLPNAMWGLWVAQHGPKVAELDHATVIPASAACEDWAICNLCSAAAPYRYGTGTRDQCTPRTTASCPSTSLVDKTPRCVSDLAHAGGPSSGKQAVTALTKHRTSRTVLITSRVSLDKQAVAKVPRCMCVPGPKPTLKRVHHMPIALIRPLTQPLR